ncbi:hypothetical protein [Sporosarcina sp. FSL K6-2383]|uniref:hypothetical protein n=1 Tax=Sporosarcina sp. FSL K6-2383 TaxID=2921556 RepID=UPI003159FAA0
MKSFFLLTVLLMAMEALIFRINSLATTEIRNGMALSIVPEKSALIAIDYGGESMFAVKNNTGQASKLENHQLTSDEVYAAS